MKIVGNEAILRFEGATKRFGNFVAVDHVDFEVHNKEIVSIIGENGAGKSTFCKMLTGVYSIDEGDMYFEGKKVNFRNTTESMKAGISMVYQERNLVGMLTGAQNICLGNEPGKGLLSEKEAYEKAIEIRDKLHLKIPLNIPVEELGAGEQQLIEIMTSFLNNNDGCTNGNVNLKSFKLGLTGKILVLIVSASISLTQQPTTAYSGLLIKKSICFFILLQSHSSSSSILAMKSPFECKIHIFNFFVNVSALKPSIKQTLSSIVSIYFK